MPEPRQRGGVSNPNPNPNPKPKPNPNPSPNPKPEPNPRYPEAARCFALQLVAAKLATTPAAIERCVQSTLAAAQARAAGTYPALLDLMVANPNPNPNSKPSPKSKPSPNPNPNPNPDPDPNPNPNPNPNQDYMNEKKK